MQWFQIRRKIHVKQEKLKTKTIFPAIAEPMCCVVREPRLLGTCRSHIWNDALPLDQIGCVK